MPSRKPFNPFRTTDRQHFPDKLKSRENISLFLEGVSRAAYPEDIKTRSAVERQEQNLTEAVFRIGDLAESLDPEPEWGAMRGMGHMLRQPYGLIASEVIWRAVHEDLPTLRRHLVRIPKT